MISPPERLWLSAAASLLSLGAFAPYWWGILRGTIRPQALSWLLWSLATWIAFSAMLSAGGGAGAWPVAISALTALCIAGVAWHRQPALTSHPADRLYLVLALAAAGGWAIGTDPLWAIGWITLLEVLGFGPILRNVYHHPRSEPALFYLLLALRNGLILLSLERQSLSTALFPGAVGALCLATAALALSRRWCLRAH